MSEVTSQYVRRRANKEFHKDCEMQTVKQSTSVMVWRSMSAHGPGRFYIVKKTTRQAQYLKELQNRMISQADDWFQDACSCTMELSVMKQKRLLKYVNVN